MKPFKTVEGLAVPLEMANVNTDQILPARYIKKPRGPGYAPFCFHDLRFADDGTPKPGFPLNAPRYQGAEVLVADANFGCGSSREGAVYALQDYGFKVLIASSFGDIFAANCLKNGLLALRLPAETTAHLRAALAQAETPRVTVDLAAQKVTGPDGGTIDFEIDAFEKECLLEGLDEIDLSLRREAEIAAFEEAYRARRPWLFRAPAESKEGAGA